MICSPYSIAPLGWQCAAKQEPKTDRVTRPETTRTPFQEGSKTGVPVLFPKTFSAGLVTKMTVEALRNEPNVPVLFRKSRENILDVYQCLA
jgi:hypothetical protein